MPEKMYDVAVKVGTYEDADGKMKNRYKNVGVVLRGKYGPYLLLDRTFSPAGVPAQAQDATTVLCSMFEPKGSAQRGGVEHRQGGNPPPGGGWGDEEVSVPF